MSDELKPCPFCNGSAKMAHNDGGPDDPNAGGHWIECNTCGASTNLRFSCGEDCRPLLVEQWNRRAPSPSVGEEGLPELPEPYARVIAYTGKYSTGGYCADVQAESVRNMQERLFTADQMRAYALAALASRPAVDADKRDAERYRLLRRGQCWSVINGLGDTLRADDLDAAIDAARHPAQRDTP